MPRLFDIDGENLDLSFRNLKAAELPIEQDLHERIETMWQAYEPYADPDFPQGFARDVDGRFWEMYLGCTLLDAGCTLLPVVARQRAGGQPDLCVIEQDHRIWIEAITPDEGAPGPDQIARPIPFNEGGGLHAAPIRQAQLRASSAFWTKAQKITSYIEQGVITPDDIRIIAISASRFGVYVDEQPLPLIMTTLFPIGDAYITINRMTGEVIDQGYHAAPVIQRQRNPVPRTAFLDERFSDISGVIWSRVGLGNLSRQTRPITYVHNPLAQVPLPNRWGIWDREFVVSANDEGWTASDILAPAPRDRSK